MKGHVILTKDELHLIQAIIRKGPVFKGLEQFALSEDRIPGEKERQSLLEKEILRQNKDGRFSIDPAAGYAFTALADSTAYLQGGMIWNDDRVMRVNIYVTDTAFTVVACKNAKEAEFLFIPTIPLLIGYLCSLIRKRESSHAETTLTMDALTPEEVRKASSALSAVEAGGAADCCLFFESCGTEKGWKGSQYIIRIDQDGEMMYSEPSAEDRTYRKVSLAEALAPVNRKILEVHTSKIIDSGELNEVEYRTNINFGNE